MDTQTAKPLDGRTALVTGGGRGIGLATAWELANLGAAVAVLARSVGEIAQAARQLTDAGHRALAVPADVSDWASVADAVQTLSSQLGPPDILVNNAAILGPLGPTVSTDSGNWAQAISVNVTGAYHCLRAVLPAMDARGWGRIVNITSGAALGSGLQGSAAYSVSKAALDMLTRAVAAEVTGSGVCVSGVSPGVVDTDMQRILRETPTEQIGTTTSERFRGFHARGELQAPVLPARLIAAVILSDQNGEIISIREERAQMLLKLLP